MIDDISLFSLHFRFEVFLINTRYFHRSEGPSSTFHFFSPCYAKKPKNLPSKAHISS